MKYLNYCKLHGEKNNWVLLKQIFTNENNFEECWVFRVSNWPHRLPGLGALKVPESYQQGLTSALWTALKGLQVVAVECLQLFVMLALLTESSLCCQNCSSPNCQDGLPRSSWAWSLPGEPELDDLDAMFNGAWATMYMEPGYPNHWSICHEDYDRSRQITVRRTAVKGRVNNLQWTAIERTAVKGRERSGLAMF